MLTHLLFLLSLISLSLQKYDGPNHAQICVTACEECFWDVTFGSTVATDDYYTGFCEDTYRYSSALLCSKFHCSAYEIKTGIDYIQSMCDKAHVELPSYDNVLANFTDESIKDVRVVGYHEITADEIINSTLLPTDDLFRLSYKTWVILSPLIGIAKLMESFQGYLCDGREGTF